MDMELFKQARKIYNESQEIRKLQQHINANNNITISTGIKGQELFYDLRLTKGDKLYSRLKYLLGTFITDLEDDFKLIGEQPKQEVCISKIEDGLMMDYGIQVSFRGTPESEGKYDYMTYIHQSTSEENVAIDWLQYRTLAQSQHNDLLWKRLCKSHSRANATNHISSIKVGLMDKEGYRAFFVLERMALLGSSSTKTQFEINPVSKEYKR